MLQTGKSLSLCKLGLSLADVPVWQGAVDGQAMFMHLCTDKNVISLSRSYFINTSNSSESHRIAGIRQSWNTVGIR